MMKTKEKLKGSGEIFCKLLYLWAQKTLFSKQHADVGTLPESPEGLWK